MYITCSRYREGCPLLPSRHVPQLQRAVRSPGGQDLAVGREREASALSAHLAKFLARDFIPESECVARRGQEVAVGGKGDGPDEILMFERGVLLPRGYVPYVD